MSTQSLTPSDAAAAALGPTVVALPRAPGGATKFCQLSRLTPWCAPSFDDSQDDDDLSNLSASSSSGSSVAPATEWEEETPVTRDDLSVPSERVLASRPSLLRASMSSPDLGRMLAPLVSPAVHRPRLKESALWRGPRPDAEAVQWRDVKGVRRLHSVHIFELIPEEVELRTPHRQGCCVVM
uniref:Uncharacterized protein n=2 Tax=Auxenochlorella protothecoides TaxID=3075 RepID=A0A1D1ZR27_AUXPR